MTPARGNDETAAVNRMVARLTSAELAGVRVRRLGRIPALFHASASPDTPFAVLPHGELFFKTGPDTVTKYIARGMRPFHSEPRQALRGYFAVPPEVIADAWLLFEWAVAAVAAAAQFGRGRPRPLRRRRRSAAG